MKIRIVAQRRPLKHSARKLWYIRTSDGGTTISTSLISGVKNAARAQIKDLIIRKNNTHLDFGSGPSSSSPSLWFKALWKKAKNKKYIRLSSAIIELRITKYK